MMNPSHFSPAAPSTIPTTSLECLKTHHPLTGCDLHIETVDYTDTLRLRRALIVSGSSDGVLHMAEDDCEHTRHFGVFGTNDLVAVVSTTHQNTMLQPDETALRFYTMVVEPCWQGCGIGTHMVEKLRALACESQAQLLWGNARLTAVGFYHRTGFRITPEVFINPVTDMASQLVYCDVSV